MWKQSSIWNNERNQHVCNLFRCLLLIDSLGTPSSHMEWMCSLTSRESNISGEIVRWPWQNWTLWEEKIWTTKKPTYQNQTLNMEFINFRHLKSSKESPWHIYAQEPSWSEHHAQLEQPNVWGVPKSKFFPRKILQNCFLAFLLFVLFPVLTPKRAKNFSFIFLAKMMNKH